MAIARLNKSSICTETKFGDVSRAVEPAVAKSSITKVTFFENIRNRCQRRGLWSCRRRSTRSPSSNSCGRAGADRRGRGCLSAARWRARTCRSTGKMIACGAADDDTTLLDTDCNAFPPAVEMMVASIVMAPTIQDKSIHSPMVAPSQMGGGRLARTGSPNARRWRQRYWRRGSDDKVLPGERAIASSPERGEYRMAPG